MCVLVVEEWGGVTFPTVFQEMILATYAGTLDMGAGKTSQKDVTSKFEIKSNLNN